MNQRDESMDELLSALQERAKELSCLYAVEEVLGQPEVEPVDACRRIVEVIPPGWQYPDICEARITLHGESFSTPKFKETDWLQRGRIVVQERRVGLVEVVYVQEMPIADEGPFLKEEARLIQTIADRIGHFVHHHAMKIHYREWESARKSLKREETGNWKIVLDLLSSTDKNLFTKISHKMLNHLCWSGIEEAEVLLRDMEGAARSDESLVGPEANQPEHYQRKEFTTEFANETFAIAEQQLSDETILFLIRKWMQEDRLGFLVRAVERNQALPEVADAIRRYQHIASTEAELSQPARMGVRVSLIRRFLSDQLNYIRIAKEYFAIRDFHGLLQNVIYTNESHGRLGGKAAGMYLANRILDREREEVPDIGEVRLPKTWHITSDMQLHFMHYNNLDEVAEQKYKEISQIRFEYPHIIYTCKNSRFPPELVQGLSVALDQLGEVPLVVRSSSVLEDRVGAAFSGKYKSLFLGNQGSKQERMDDLCDAIAEVYASMFGPDPMEYRAERGLLDFSEEMGIIIQEVVGQRVGPYYFPAFAGVALSRNEFRWSPRIRREDGLVRIVPGLGTRSVDRVGDDYPIMFAPGQPNLRVNLSDEEILRYAPRDLDAINLETNDFETVAVADLVLRYPGEFPLANRIVSVNEDGAIRRLGLSDDNLRPENLVVTFEGLISDQRFVRQAQAILRVLEEKMESPVDIEFAHDGRHLYLLQCRTQTHSDLAAPAPIPKDVPQDRIVFSASKHVSNGVVPDITHVVYVDPERYANLPERKDLREVGRAVSRLNKLLPKRQFILMGPGRWGSRGDIKLGVPVGYSDINNTSALIEIARRTGSYTPDLSFGTHFFQDLTEARIRYLPLYPDEKGNEFNERFLTRSPNILPNLAPEFAGLSDTIRVIDVPATTGGLVLKILMNADLDQALAILADPESRATGVVRPSSSAPMAVEPTKDHSPWRMLMVEQIAGELDAERFGVKGFYVFGSVKNQTAGPASDIDVLIHFDGDAAQRESLLTWLEGWGLCLDELNYLRTGYRTGNLLDIHLVTNEDIEKKTSFAVKIGAVTDAARPLPTKRPSPPPSDPSADSHRGVLSAPPRRRGPVSSSWPRSRGEWRVRVNADRNDHSLRVITWNVRKGKGANGEQPSMSRLAEVIGRRSPSVVLLQEIFKPADAPDTGQTGELGLLLDMEGAFGPNMFYRRGCHGNAILSRLPITDSENIDLSTNPVERRGALYARLETPDGPLHVLSIHLGLNSVQRRRQVRRIARALADRVPAGEPLVMGGDFNDWTGRLHPRIREHCRVSGTLDDLSRLEQRSWPSARPRFGLDRFYVRHVEIESCFVLKDSGLRVLSDHLPVEADLHLRTTR